METEGTQIHILGDVLVAVASLDLKVPTTRSSDFVHHSYDYRPNWTPLSPVTIINNKPIFI